MKSAMLSPVIPLALLFVSTLAFSECPKKGAQITDANKKERFFESIDKALVELKDGEKLDILGGNESVSLNLSSKNKIIVSSPCKAQIADLTTSSLRDTLIENLKIVPEAGEGIHIYGKDRYSRNVTLKNLEVSAVKGGSSGIIIEGGNEGITFDGGMVTRFTRNGIEVFPKARSITIKNMRIVANGRNGLLIDTPSGILIENNDILANGDMGLRYPGNRSYGIAVQETPKERTSKVPSRLNNNRILFNTGSLRDLNTSDVSQGRLLEGQSGNITTKGFEDRSLGAWNLEFLGDDVQQIPEKPKSNSDYETKFLYQYARITKLAMTATRYTGGTYALIRLNQLDRCAKSRGVSKEKIDALVHKIIGNNAKDLAKFLSRDLIGDYGILAYQFNKDCDEII